MSKKINALKVNIGPLHGFDFIPIFDPTVGEEERITVDKLKSYVLSGFTGSITGGTGNDTYVTGFTYNNSNKLTISQNLGQPDLNLYINQFSGLTVNGNLSSNTISGNTLIITNNIDSALRTLKNSSNVDTINWGASNLIGSTANLYWDNGLLKDSGPNLSIDWVNRTLNDNNEDVVLDWQNKTMSGMASIVTNTISASTYYNLPRDIYVTGGTYNSGTGVVTFTNSTGGTFNVTGFNTGLTASNYVVQGYLAAAQTIPSNVDTVIQFSDDFDPQNWWNTSTYRLQPTVAGYYNVTLQVLVNQGSVTNNQYNTQIRKNGSSQESIWQNQITTSVGLSQGNDKIIYFNGSTDYVDFTIFNGNPGTVDINGSGQKSQSFFHASLITGLNSSSFTASNLGSGSGIFAQKSGVDFQFKSLTSTGNTLTISNNSNTINIEVAPTNNFTGGTVNGRTTFTNGLSANTMSATTLVTSGDITANSLVSTQSSGNEGGEIRLSTSQNGNNLSGGTVTIDVYTNKLRIFESGGSNRGVYIDLTTVSNSVGTNLSTDTYVTGATYSSNTLTIKQSQGVPDITTTIGLTIKAGTVSNTSFTGNPKTYQVTFSTPYSNNYSISITGSDARTFTYESKTVNGFIINTNSNTSLTGDVDWQTIRNGES